LSHVLHIVIDFIRGLANVINISVKVACFCNKSANKYTILAKQEATTNIQETTKEMAPEIYLIHYHKCLADSTCSISL